MNYLFVILVFELFLFLHLVLIVTVLSQLLLLIPTNILALLALTSYLRILRTDAGHPSESTIRTNYIPKKYTHQIQNNNQLKFNQHLNQQYYQSSQCQHCNSLKPPRSHHCKRCRICVLKMDHHCPWIGRCVGAYNYKFFINFLLWSSLYCITIFLSLTIKLLNDNHHQSKTLSNSKRHLIIAAIILSAIFIVFITSLLTTHLYLITHALTTLEHLADRKFISNLVQQIMDTSHSHHSSPLLPTSIRQYLLRRKLNQSIGRLFSNYRKHFLINNSLDHHFLHPYHPDSSLSLRQSLHFYRLNWESVMGRNILICLLPLRPHDLPRHSRVPTNPTLHV